MCSGDANGSAEKDTSGDGVDKADPEEPDAEKSSVCACYCITSLLPPE